MHPISLVSSSGWGGVDNQFIVQVSQSSTKVKSTESSSSSLARDDNSRFGRSSTDVEYASFSDDEEVQTDTEGSSKTDECASKWDDALDDDHVSIDDEENIDGSSEDDEEAENANRSQWIQLGEERASTWALQSHRDESDAISFERASMSAADMQAWPQHTTSAISRITIKFVTRATVRPDSST